MFSVFHSQKSKRSGINYPFIASVVGSMCLFETLFLLVCFAVALYTRGGDAMPFLYTIGIMALVGSSLFFYGKLAKKNRNTGIREGMLSVTTTWLILSLIGILPFVFGSYTPTVIDAFFETERPYSPRYISYPTEFCSGVALFSGREVLVLLSLPWL